MSTSIEAGAGTARRAIRLIAEEDSKGYNMDTPNGAQKQTAKRLIQLIAEHSVNAPSKKLKKGELAKAAGITRQALHRFYSYLYPYISGEKPISELLGEADETRALTHGLDRIRALESETESLQSEMEARIDKIKMQHITSLMKSDLAMHDVDGLRARLESQSLHNDILVAQVKELKAALLAVQSMVPHSGRSEARDETLKIPPFDIDLEKLFSKFQTNPDMAWLDKAKTQAIQDAALRAWTKLGSHASIVVLFIDRYLCSFDKFCKRFVQEREGQFLIIRTPIFSSLQLKALIISRLDHSAKVKVVIPYCDSQSVIKAQRSFYFSSVPDQELEKADRMPIGLVSDPRVNETLLYRVEQGD